MKAKFKVNDRLALIGILPTEGNALTLKVQTRLQEKLGFEEKELKHLEVKTVKNEDGTSQTQWSAEKDREGKELDFSEMEEEMLKKELKKLEEEEKLTAATFAVYTQFFPEPK